MHEDDGRIAAAQNAHRDGLPVVGIEVLQVLVVRRDTAEQVQVAQSEQQAGHPRDASKRVVGGTGVHGSSAIVRRAVRHSR